MGVLLNTKDPTDQHRIDIFYEKLVRWAHPASVGIFLAIIFHADEPGLGERYGSKVIIIVSSVWAANLAVLGAALIAGSSSELGNPGRC